MKPFRIPFEWSPVSGDKQNTSVYAFCRQTIDSEAAINKIRAAAPMAAADNQFQSIGGGTISCRFVGQLQRCASPVRVSPLRVQR
jgi:hypothetical protein